MSRRIVPFLSAMLVLPATSLVAQGNSQCSAYTANDLNICNAAIDGAVVFHPVLGMLVSGGNPILGQFGSLGGFPHFTIAARVNATKLHTPDLDYDGTGTTVAAADEITAPAPVIEAGLGVFKGMGLSGLLAVDLLASAQLLPTDQFDNFSVDKDATTIGSVALSFGFGARVGVTQQKGALPAISASVMRRSLPTVTYGDVTAGDQYRYSFDMKATNLRAVAGYHFSALSVGAGLGWDKFTGNSDVEFTPTVGPTQLVSADLDQTRTSAFLNAGLALGGFNLMGELGWQMGKDQNLATTFEDNNPSDNRMWASAALRFAF